MKKMCLLLGLCVFALGMDGATALSNAVKDSVKKLSDRVVAFDRLLVKDGPEKLAQGNELFRSLAAFFGMVENVYSAQDPQKYPSAEMNKLKTIGESFEADWNAIRSGNLANERAIERQDGLKGDKKMITPSSYFTTYGQEAIVINETKKLLSAYHALLTGFYNRMINKVQAPFIELNKQVENLIIQIKKSSLLELEGYLNTAIALLSNAKKAGLNPDMATSFNSEFVFLKKLTEDLYESYEDPYKALKTLIENVRSEPDLPRLTAQEIKASGANRFVARLKTISDITRIKIAESAALKIKKMKTI